MPNFKIFNGKQYIYVDSFDTKGEALSEAKRNTGFDTKIETAHNEFVVWRSTTRKRSNDIRKIAKKIVAEYYKKVVVEGIPSKKKYTISKNDFQSKRVPDPYKDQLSILKYMKMYGSKDNSYKVISVE